MFFCAGTGRGGKGRQGEGSRGARYLRNLSLSTEPGSLKQRDGW